MDSNSIEAFNSLNITESQQIILSAFRKLGKATDKDICKLLDYPINKVSNRVGELLKQGKIEKIGDSIVDGRRCRICRIKI